MLFYFPKLQPLLRSFWRQAARHDALSCNSRSQKNQFGRFCLEKILLQCTNGYLGKMIEATRFLIIKKIHALNFNENLLMRNYKVPSNQDESFLEYERRQYVMLIDTAAINELLTISIMILQALKHDIAILFVLPQFFSSCLDGGVIGLKSQQNFMK